MYDSKRNVTYHDIMYTFAGKTYLDCDFGILVTSGKLMNLAKIVSEKLNIEFKENFIPNLVISKNIKVLSSESSLINSIWLNLILPLKGREMYTESQKRKNVIIDVNDQYIKRQSSNFNDSKINYEVFEVVISLLLENKSITRDEINQVYRKQGSSIIFAILSTFPFVVHNIIDNQKTLVLDKGKLKKFLENVNIKDKK